MGRNELLLSNKNATYSARGYTYQALKTLELWLDNYLNKIDNEIYCEYEDDIFQKNQLLSSVEFHQIKLYSSNFSFSSKEIKKTIVNFFILDKKENHQNKEKTFIFYTNAKIANQTTNNDASLLKEWSENKHSLSNLLLEKCAEKLKKIIEEYILEKELDILVEPDYWESFAKKIQWNFSHKVPEIEMEDIHARIEKLLEQLEFFKNESPPEGIVGHLFKIISLKTANSNIEEKKLTTTDLEIALLRLGKEGDLWYSTVFEAWNNQLYSSITIGEILEITDASRYARRRKPLSNHLVQWKELLTCIINSQEISNTYLQSVLYELIYLDLLYNSEKKCIEIHDLKNLQSYIEKYFCNINWISEPKHFEDSITLVTRISLAKNEVIDRKKLVLLIKNLYKKLINKIKTETDNSEVCRFLEAKIWLYFNLSITNILIVNVDKAFKSIELILKKSEQAPLHDISKLSFRLNKFFESLAQSQVKTHQFEIVLNNLESICEKVDSIVDARNMCQQQASRKISRANSFLNGSNRSAKLKALEYLEKAQELYYRKYSAPLNRA